MLRTLYRSSRKIGVRIKHFFAHTERIVLDIPSEKDFFESLTPILNKNLTEPKLTCSEQAVSYFRNRESFFFINSDEITKAVETVGLNHPEWIEQAYKEADELSNGYVQTYSQRAHLLTPDDWAFIPLGPGQDILYRQRPHRFSFVTRLAVAAVYGHKNSLKTLENVLLNWFQSVEPNRKFKKKYRPIQTSSHVALYRIISVTWTLTFLSSIKPENHQLEMLLLRLLLVDSNYMLECLPNTTPNNHLLADGFGLWYVGSLYPEFTSAKKWQKVGFDVFKKEILRQIYRDGTSFEHSIHYQEHVCEMGVAYIQLCKRNSWDIDTEISDRVKAMLNFQCIVNGHDDKNLAIGDTTEDPLFPLDSANGWCVSSLRLMNSLLFFETKCCVDIKSLSIERFFWLNAGNLPENYGLMDGKDFSLDFFANGGYGVIKHSHHDKTEHLVYRTGPAENIHMVSGHMHADYLNVFLSIDGVPVLVPSGTYTYRGKALDWPMPYPYWRDYFMSPQSGNGLIIEDKDLLNRPKGNFPGGTQGNVACRVETTGVSKGQKIAMIGSRVIGTSEYSGWERRVLSINNDYWVILDLFPESVSHFSSYLSFQCSIQSTIEISKASEVKIDVENIQLKMTYSNGLDEPECREGSIKPRAGWVSNSYGVKTKAPQIFFPIKHDCSISALILRRTNGLNKNLIIDSINQKGSDLELIVNYDNFEDKIEFFSQANQFYFRWNRSKNNEIIIKENLSITSEHDFNN